MVPMATNPFSASLGATVYQRSERESTVYLDIQLSRAYNDDPTAIQTTTPLATESAMITIVMIRGVHSPPKTMMHFPCFRFFPLFPKIVQTPWKLFSNLAFSKHNFPVFICQNF